MCKECSIEYGAPVDTITDDMRAARTAMEAIYAADWGRSGGALHVQIDDTNVDDHFFNAESRAIVERDWREWYANDPAEGLTVCLEAFDALAKLTAAERATVVEWPELFVPAQVRGSQIHGMTAGRDMAVEEVFIDLVEAGELVHAPERRTRRVGAAIKAGDRLEVRDDGRIYPAPKAAE